MGGKGSGGNHGGYTPSSDKALTVNPGDNSRYIQNNLEIMNLPSIDLNDPDQVRDRCNEYFQIRYRQDMKPTVAGLAMALGINRRTLWALVNNQLVGGTYRMELDPRSLDWVKKAYAFMELQWEDYMQNGKINPVSGIFLGKNNYGYRDQQEVVVTPNTGAASDTPSEEIEKKYLDSVVTDPEE